MTLLVVGAGDLGLRVATLIAGTGKSAIAVKRTPVPLPPNVTGVWSDIAQLDLDALPAIDAVLYCLTPDRRDPETYRRTYVERLDGLLAALDRRGLATRLLFAGSTAVYAAEDGRWVDEDTPTTAASDATLPFNGRILREAERLLIGRPGSCALRIGGIYGPGREMLLRRLQTPGATVQREPPLWTNRMHIDDVARAVRHLLEQPALPTVVNLVDDQPTPQAEVLDGLAELRGLPRLPAAPVDPTASQGKRVANTRLRASGFRCRYPSWREGYAALLKG
jgi:nucleoside-diphosphate-sugar epimerase